jgi:hypothetical protein
MLSTFMIIGRRLKDTHHAVAIMHNDTLIVYLLVGNHQSILYICDSDSSSDR